MEPDIKKKTGFFSTNSSKKPSERPSLIKTSELATSENTETNEEMIVKEDMFSTEQWVNLVSLYNSLSLHREERSDVNDVTVSYRNIN